jgi:hypothetical protein
VLDTLLAINQRIQERSCDTNSSSSQGNSLEDIRSTLKASIDEDLKMFKSFREPLPDLKEYKDRSLSTVHLSETLRVKWMRVNLPIERPPTVITQHNTLDTILNRQLDILHSLNPLQHNRHRALPSYPLQILPREALIDILPHQPSESTALTIFTALTTAHGRFNNNSLRGSLISLAFSGDGGVDGHEDGFYAEGASAAEEFDCFGAVGVYVELEEEGMAWGSCADDVGESV